MDGLFGCVVFEIHGSRWSFKKIGGLLSEMCENFVDC
jgi:hypothetical protein